MTLSYATFIETVQDEGDLRRERAEAAVRATLETLGERISHGEAEDVADELPDELQVILTGPGSAEPFDAAEFVRRVAMREDTDEVAAERHAEAVFVALRRSVSAAELEDVAAQLPADLRAMLRGQRFPRPRVDGRTAPDAAAFYRDVADRAGVDEDAARVATHAALEVLADRISGGEADDVAALLPPELREAIARGTAKSDGAARPLSLDDFLAEIAALEGTNEEEARRHARAVFAVLREHVGDGEMRDIFEQVPDDYASVLGPRP